MNYVYAGTKARTLETDLLTDTQVELLVGARTVDEFNQNLEDTFLAPYLAEYTGSNLSAILEASIRDAKRELEAMTPNPRLIEVLWLKYDFYNLKSIIKGDLAGRTDEAILETCFDIGTIEPRVLLAAYRNDDVSRVSSLLEATRREAAAYTTIAEIDLVMNLHYLTAIRGVADELEDEFATEYVTRLIDMFNLMAALRLHNMYEVRVRDIFVDGGSVPRAKLETVESILTAIQRYGGPHHWKDAIEAYHHDGRFSRLEKAREDYMNDWLKWQSHDIFSPAPLFAYFTAKKNNVQLIRAIYVGKVTGLEEHEIRENLRKVYR